MKIQNIDCKKISEYIVIGGVLLMSILVVYTLLIIFANMFGWS